MSCYENLVMKTQMNYSRHYSTYASGGTAVVLSKQKPLPYEEQIQEFVRRVQEAECIIVGGASGLSAAGGGDFYYSDTIEQSISDKKNLRKVVSDYRRSRPTIDAHKKLSGKKAEAYYRANEADFIIYEAALRQLKVLAPGKKLPATSKLNTEIKALISEKNAAYNTYRTAKAEYEQLATAKRNAEQILHGTQSRQKKQEQER